MYRSYITFDILRRVLGDYFRYNVEYVMNITDIDDKIIKRARQLHLFEEYVKNTTVKQTILSDILLALEDLEKNVNQMDADKKAMTVKAIEKLKVTAEIFEKSANAMDDLKVCDKSILH